VTEQEELSQYFYDKLIDKGSRPGVVLVQFFSTFYEKDFDAKLIPFFSRMVKLYGRNVTFLGLLDLFDYEDANLENVQRLVAYFIKKRIENQFSIQEQEDLSKEFKPYLKDVKRAQKQKLEGVKDPFDDNS